MELMCSFRDFLLSTQCISRVGKGCTGGKRTGDSLTSGLGAGRKGKYAREEQGLRCLVLQGQVTGGVAELLKQRLWECLPYLHPQSKERERKP